MHPFVKLLLFFFLLLVAGAIGALQLIALLFVVCALALKLQCKGFLTTLQRMRWFFLSIFLIYALGTPGELVPQFPLSVAPSYEGLQLGLLQISRLTIALATLTVMLATSSKAELMIALHVLLKPLCYFGLDVERFSVRLLLTLNYVDEFASNPKASFSFHHIDDIRRELEAIPTQDVVVLEQRPFNLADKIAMVLMLFILMVMIAMRFV
ncbi:hypothetical protein [Methylotenera sp.]|uniref:hypothetical protein n=1 Tax=Methylotenera sp. TaxID=2051956 RepID=UPI002ED9B614